MPQLTAANFPQFFASTRGQRAADPKLIINMAQRTNYPFMWLVKGALPNDIGKDTGGSQFEIAVKPSDIATFQAYNPGAPSTINIGGNAHTFTFPKRFYRSHVGWTTVEYNQATNGGDFTKLLDFKKLKMSDGKTDHINGLDYLLFARPDYSSMEATPSGADAGKCYSLMCYISEDTTRYLPPSSVWTTSQLVGRDPSTSANSYWRNPVETYTPGQLDHQFNGIIPAFDRMQTNLYYRKPPVDDGDTMQQTNVSDLIVYTNKDGINKLKAIFRDRQDRWEKANDPSMAELYFDGIPIVYCPQLDTELLDQSGSTYSGTAYPDGKPRYIWVNKRYTRPVFESKEMMNTLDPMVVSSNQPDSYVLWTQSHLQLLCVDRRKNGIIAPSA